jgi:hypothetical protein
VCEAYGGAAIAAIGAVQPAALIARVSAPRVMTRETIFSIWTGLYRPPSGSDDGVIPAL